LATAGRPDPDGVAVLRPSGCLDRRTVARIDQALADIDAAGVIIDLSECVLNDQQALADLLGAGGPGPVERCLVCGRLSGRRLLARAGARMPVFATVQDAVQARVLAAAGFGSGWS
jgi:hypothetical protein